MSFNDIVDDCLKNIASNLCIDDLLPLSLVNKRCKNLFFEIFKPKFISQRESLETHPQNESLETNQNEILETNQNETTIFGHKIRFRQLIVSLKLWDYLKRNDICELYVLAGSGKNLIIMDFIMNRIPKSRILIVVGNKSINHWNKSINHWNKSINHWNNYEILKNNEILFYTKDYLKFTNFDK